MNKRIWITCLIILGCACLLMGIIAAAGTGFYLWDKTNPQPTITAAVSSGSLTDATQCPTGSCQKPTEDILTGNTIVAPTVELPTAVMRIMDKIQIEVIAIRGLHPSAAIPRALLSPDELRNKVINDFLIDYTPKAAETDSIALSVFGLLPPGYDLINFYENLYSEQIAGYYDDETKEMYVVRGSSFGGTEKMTYAHEFTHVLQDQKYDMRNGLKVNDEDCERDSERCAAISALIEGDASLTEYLWFYQYSSEQDLSDIQTFYESFESPVYDSAPEYMKADFLFPYESGQEFVQVLYDEGSWQAINNAYFNPPVSTEQIMHPSRYPSDTPVAVTLPDLTSALGEGWEQIQDDVVGEWYTYLMLAKGYRVDTQINGQTARKAAEGWGGDAFQIYTNSDTGHTVLVINTSWDTRRDATEFLDAFVLYGTRRWGPSVSQTNNMINWQTTGQSATIRFGSSATLVVIGPDLITINLVVQTLDLE